MDPVNSGKNKHSSVFSDIAKSMAVVLKSRYFYIGLLTLGLGATLNLVSQTYLNNNFEHGKSLPMLSDLILDNVPVLDVSLAYDLFCIVIFVTVFVYIVHRRAYNRLPYILLLCGIFYILRSIFIVLTPLGNPPHFNGSDPFFNGFSRYELGVYPSGHVGNSFLLLLLVRDRNYKTIMWVWLSIIIVALFLSHGHYSIDILSGFLFAYAVRAFGDRYLTMFELGSSHDGGV